MHFLLRFLVTAVALYLIAMYIPGFAIAHWYDAVIAAIIFGIVNTLIGPVLRLLSAPITFLTAGLFSIVVNWALFALTVWLSPGFHTTGSPWPSWAATLVGAIIMMLVNIFVTTPMRSPSQA